MKYFIKTILVLLLSSGVGCSTPDGSAQAKPEVTPRAKSVNEKIPGKVANRVRYVIGEISVTEDDIINMQAKIKVLLPKLRGSHRKAAVEELIQRAIVRMAAARESIMVSDARVENEVRRRRNISGAGSEASFKKLMEAQTGFHYELWFEELPYQILKGQVTQLLIPMALPSEAELRRFYKKNKKNVGFEVSFREMIFAPRNIKDERRLSDMLRKLWKELRKNPRSFAKKAKTHPDNISPRKKLGGYYSFVALHELARNDERMAGVLFNLKKGEVSPLFRDRHNRYVVLKLEKKRTTPFEKVKPFIQQRMMLEKEGVSFKRWIDRQRKQVAIIEL